jgi:hypothetical protein
MAYIGAIRPFAQERLSMKLATFTEGSRTRIGVIEGDEIVDLDRSSPDYPRT